MMRLMVDKSKEPNGKPRLFGIYLIVASESWKQLGIK